MSNLPPDVEGQCNGWLRIGDDYGDNDRTFRCQLAPGHEGWHEDHFGRDGERKRMRWERDQRPDIEPLEDQMRGGDDAHAEEPVPEEPGEHYLAGFCDQMIESEEHARLRAECEVAAKRALLLACERPVCTDECPVRRGCERVCLVCGEPAEYRCRECHLWLCGDHRTWHWRFCAKKAT